MAASRHIKLTDDTKRQIAEFRRFRGATELAMLDAILRTAAEEDER